jgi:putative ABC transport system substrate-binding protein
MNRRHFISLLGAAAAAGPRPMRAQQLTSTMARIGFLGAATAAGSQRAVDELRSGLRELGYVEGRNISVEFRWADESYDRLPQLVSELIATRIDLLITHGTPGTRAARQATSTIPIVMAISGDAVATGLVSNLAKPEANVTGSTYFLPELNAKRLEVLREACPSITHPSALSNPDNPVSRPIMPAMQSAATALGLTLAVARLRGAGEFDRAFHEMAGGPVDSLVVTEDGEFAPNFRSIAALALQYRLPSIGAKEYGQAGGLIGYGANILALYRRAAYFVDRILRGAKPADLPVEQPTRFDLVINLLTAKTLGLALPPTLLVRADEVIG